MKTSTVNAIAIGFISLLVVTIVGAVVLESTDRDPTRIFTFALAIIPVLLVQLYQGEKNNRDNSEIKRAVNGELTRQLEDVKSHVTDQLAKQSDMNTDDKKGTNRVNT